MREDTKAVEFEMPGLKETLFLVPDERTVIALRLRRSRCWTPADVEAVRGMAPEERRAVAEARILFDGSIRRPPEPPRTALGASGDLRRGIRPPGAPPARSRGR